MHVPVDPTTEMMLDAWADHRQAEPTPIGDSAPYFAIAEIDEWQRLDDAYRLLVGTRLAARALEERRRT
jgi:hypothetical protein